MIDHLKDIGYEIKFFPPYTLVYKRSLPHLPDLVAAHPVLGTQTLVTGRTAIRVMDPGFVVRTLTHGGLLRHITGRKFLSLGRSVRELSASAYLTSQGVLTPEIAALRYRRQGIFYSMEVITRMVPDSVDLLTYLESTPDDSLALIRRTGMLVSDLHRLGVYHFDLHVKNILLDRDKTPWIIDLDNAYRFKELPSLLRRKNLSRFARSLRKWEKSGRIRLSTGWNEAFLEGYES